MLKNLLSLTALALVSTGLPPAFASEKHIDSSQSRAIDALLSCRRITASAERLACVDRELDRLSAGIDSGSVAVVDKAQVEKRRREQFGLAPHGDALFAAEPGTGVVKQVTSAIAGAFTDTYGKWTFMLQDGSKWHQIDDYTIGSQPRAGTPVVITRAALNSFKMSVGGQAGIRVRRIG